MPFTAGQILTADNLNDITPLVAVKTADETVNNSTTLQNDDHLLLSLTANTNYVIDMTVIYNSGTTPDFKFTFTEPSGTTMAYSLWAQLTNFQFFYLNEGSTAVIDGTGGDTALFVRGGVYVGGTAGTLQLQWAQNTANASNTTVKKGSYMILTPVAS